MTPIVQLSYTRRSRTPLRSRENQPNLADVSVTQKHDHSVYVLVATVFEYYKRSADRVATMDCVHDRVSNISCSPVVATHSLGRLG